MLGGYYASGPWQEKLKLRIEGKLTEKLAVSYDLEQQPDTPDKFDVNVTYDKTHLTFGDFQANFSNNEFVSTSKFLNGVMITSTDDWYALTLVPSSKLKSETQSLVSQSGNNTKGPYSLGHGSIIEGSEKIQLNNVTLNAGSDYTIDYFGGTITFSRILSPSDVFTYSYEFTNMLDVFFPTVSQRDFVGLEAKMVVNPVLLGMPAAKKEKAVKTNTEYFPSLFEPGPASATKEVIVIPTNISIEASSEAGGSYVVQVNDIPVIVMHRVSGEASPLIKAEQIEERLQTLADEGVTSGEIKSSVVNGSGIVVSRGMTIATASPAESQMNNMQPSDLADKWRDNIIRGLSNPETFESTSTQESVRAQNEWESTGVYKLKNTPIIPYSEKISFGGTQLKKFEDYLIDYNDGTITLLRPNLPSADNPLSVEYEYTEVASESETLPGNGKGPYVLAHEGVIEGSEQVYVNNIPFVRELDYTIDYSQGKITFYTAVPTTTNVLVKYRYIVIASTPPPVTPATPRSLTMGVSYLKESGKRGTTPPSISAADTFNGSDIINNNNTIWLKNWPVPRTEVGNVSLSRNNIVMTYGVDYIFPTVEASPNRTVIPTAVLQFITDSHDLSDGLDTGTIVYLTTLEASDTITINYTYSKKATDHYTGTGSAASPQYILNTLQNVVPGSEQVYIKDNSVPGAQLKFLTRSTSIDTFSIGSDYLMNYTNTPSITFNPQTVTPVMLSTSSFYIDVLFVAQASVTDRPIEHDVLGFNGTYTLGDYLNIQGAFARSKTDQVFSTVSTNETFNGDNSKRNFTLHSLGPIIEDSEQVFLNGNKLNRDSQYVFTYDQPGQLAISLITPTTLDVISVDYSFQSTSGTITNVNEKQGTALSTGIDFKPSSNLELETDYKKIDADFAPMGGTSIPLGSDYRHAYARVTPVPSVWPSLWLSGDVKDANVPIGNFTDVFLHSYDKNYAGGFNTFDLAQFNLGYRDYMTLDDLTPGSTTHTSDFKSNSYSLSVQPRTVGFGEFSLTNIDNATKTLSYTDTVDKVLPQDSIVDYYHTNNTFALTKRVGLVLDYQVNMPRTISYEAGTRAPSSGHLIQREEVDDLSSNLTWDLTFGGIKRLYAYWNDIGHRDTDFVGGTINSTVNETYHADFVPIDQITTSIDHNRQEIPTITTAFGNPKTDHSAATVNITPYSTTSLGWSGALDDALQQTGVRTSGNSNSYSINHTAITGPNYKLTTAFNLSTSILNAPNGTEESVATDTRTFSQNYNISYNPTNIWTITTGFGQQDYTNTNNSQLTPVNTNSQAQTTSVGTDYKLTSDLDLSGDYSVTVTRVPDTSAHVADIDGHAVYKFFTYGTFNYDWSQEENGGQIISGVFSPQDFSKIIQSLALNIVLPQNGQLILSSIVFKAAVKWATFQDRITPDNSFKATMLSFEGTFNF